MPLAGLICLLFIWQRGVQYAYLTSGRGTRLLMIYPQSKRGRFEGPPLLSLSFRGSKRRGI